MGRSLAAKIYQAIGSDLDLAYEDPCLAGLVRWMNMFQLHEQSLPA